jgi:hypothetical protein
MKLQAINALQISYYTGKILMFGLFRKKKETTVEPKKKESAPIKKRVYVLDFDRTITILHTGALAYGNELNPAFIHKNIKKGFADFVTTAIDQGHAVYIASYNDDANAETVEGEALSGHDLIKLYMDLVFGQDQTIFSTAQRNGAGETTSVGNIIAINTQDLKQYHLNIIFQQEGMDQENHDDMKQIYLLEDDEDIVRFYMDKGCTTIVPYSASRSADTAANKSLFTSYMPESFKS